MSIRSFFTICFLSDMLSKNSFVEKLTKNEKVCQVPGVLKKYWHLINNQIKVFYLISKMFSILSKSYANLDFETKIVEIH